MAKWRVGNEEFLPLIAIEAGASVSYYMQDIKTAPLWITLRKRGPAIAVCGIAGIHTDDSLVIGEESIYRILFPIWMHRLVLKICVGLVTVFEIFILWTSSSDNRPTNLGCTTWGCVWCNMLSGLKRNHRKII